MYTVILVVAIFLLAGCGNTVKTSIKAAKCALDIPVAMYEDGKDNAQTVVDEFKHPVPPPSK
jgi:hypothetical protein